MKTSSFFFKISKNSQILTNLYIYYNIYIRNIKFFFKSTQFKEDESILKLFKKKGYYVDVGCYHPVRYNNTFKMFKLGWSGINIDLNPLSIKLFNVARPKDINICAAISNKKKRALYFDNELSPINTLEANHTNYYKKAFGQSIKKSRIIKTKKLSEILKENKIFKIDFLNIDVEGHELNVLKSINLKKIYVKVVCIEIIEHNQKAKKVGKNAIKYLKTNGFKFKFKKGINYIFTQ